MSLFDPAWPLATCRLGWGCLDDLAHDVERIGGSTALVVTHEALTHATPVAHTLEALWQAGVGTVLDEHTTRVPDVAHVTEGVKLFTENDCDLLVSVGGGNAHDLAKAVGIVAKGGGEIVDYEGKGKLRGPSAPHIAVNTTAGTGSEMSHFAFITSHRKGNRICIDDERMTPRVAINDPATHVGLSPELTAMSGMNVLTHAIESHLGGAGTQLTDSMALDAIALVVQHLPQAVLDGHDEEARTAMAQAEQLAGLAYNATGLGLADAMSLSLTAIYDAPHGACNAILLPYVMAYDLPFAPDRLADIGSALLGEKAPPRRVERARAAASAVADIARDLRLPSTLRQLGMGEEVGYMSVWNVLRSPLIESNPRPATEAGVGAILADAVEGTPITEALLELQA